MDIIINELQERYFLKLYSVSLDPVVKFDVVSYRLLHKY